MSRSYRKNPVCGITTADSEKRAKRNARRKLRHASKAALRCGAEVFPLLREVSNVWDFPKDGRWRFDPAKHPKLMRK